MLEEVRKTYQATTFQPLDRPSHKFDCPCDMCALYEQKLVKNYLHESHKKLRHNIEERLKNPALSSADQYMWLLRKLLLPTNKIVMRGVELYIPDICFYKDGQAISLFLNRDITDYTLKQLPKDRLANLFIRKTLNQRRRKYRDKLAALTKSEQEINQVNKKPIGFVQKKKEGLKIDTKDAVVVRFNESYEQLFNQTDFFMLMERRKKDSIFGTLDFVMNYIPLKDDPKETGIIKYFSENVESPELFDRAQQLMKVYATNILPSDKDYISDDQETIFCDSLRQNYLKDLFAYITYKIISFIESFHDTKISKGVFHWKIDRFKRPLLMNAHNITFKQGPKYDWTNEVVEKRIKKIQFETFYQKHLPQLPAIQMTISDRMESIMDAQYEKMKYHYGMSMKIPQNTEQTENNIFFRRLHPECKVDLSDGLISTDTIDDFKRIHLGYIKKKKPIVTEFKTNMLTTLHSLTARRKSVNAKISSLEKSQKISLSPPKMRKSYRTRADSTMASFKINLDRLDDVNRSINFYDI